MIQSGSRVGRYQILDLIGTGPKGVVYSAYDPELDRRVALKLLPAEAGSERLQREARAVARIAHPNVVAIHDVGAFEDRIFIAMEFVDGVTLSAWSAGQPPIGKRLELLVQAGRGLLAAHHAGLAHRDFKADNVLVGRNGWVRVTDFAGEEADAAATQADRFAFCQVAWECLHGEPPFQGSADMPARARRALVEGLRASPAERPPLERVLDQLVEAPSRNRLLVAVAALLLLAVPVIGWRAFQRERDRSLCAAGPAQLAGVWDGPRRESLKSALASGDLAMVRGVESALDEYARRWGNDYAVACEATRLQREQSSEVLDLRMACLDQRRRELDAFVTTLRDAPKRLPEAAVMVHDLVPVSECDNLAALRGTVRPNGPPKLLEELRTRLAKLDAKHLVGDAEAEGAEAKSLAEAAIRAGVLDIAAGAVAAEAATLRAQYQIDSALKRYYEAAMLAAMAHDDVRLAHILSRTVTLEGIVRSHFQQAFRTASYQRTVVARLGGNPRAEWELLSSIGTLEWRMDRLPEAEAHYREALAWFERSGSSNLLEHAALMLLLADALGDQGKLEEARGFYDRGRAIYRAQLGPNHERTLVIDTDVAVDLLEMGRAAEAIPRQREIVVLARRIQSAGQLGLALNVLGWLLHDTGQPREAESFFRESLAAFASVKSDDYTDRSSPYTGLGAVAIALGRPKSGIADLEKALRLQDLPELKDSLDRAETEVFLARALGSGTRAVALATHARDVLAAHPLGVRRAKLVADAEAVIKQAGSGP